MAVSNKRGPLLIAAFALTFSAMMHSAWADEIQLKDGKKLYGVIVAYEDNMFKVKTDFGFVLVEKDKILKIIPSTPAAKSEPQPAAKKDTGGRPSKPPNDSQPQPEPADASSSEASPASANAGGKSANPSSPGKVSPKVTSIAVKPELPTSAPAGSVAAPPIKGTSAAPANAMASGGATPALPKEPEVPANREEIQGNLYTNYTHGFRMYKAPSWNLIEEARSALPNAIVAMGTSNESTLMVIGKEKAKEPLDMSAAAVEKRLQDVYTGYQRLSQRKTMVGGLPAVEYQYRGTADDHVWSGKLVVVGRGSEIFTVLGMTYADSDLIQIQENVIARTVASLDFNVH